MKYILPLIVFLVGCVSNGTGTLGNGQIDIDLGDGKLFGNREAYLLSVTAAQYAVYRNPFWGESIKAKLTKAKEDVTDLTDKYPAEQAAELALAALREKCGFWCTTVAGQQYLEGYIVLASEMVDEVAPDVKVSPAQFLDGLIAQIELVEKSL